tara:strand:+ start:15086 stop:15862 length:777 start_codon:yes stop_codon:yes gene_type:complete
MIKITRDNYPPSDRYKIGLNKGREKWRVFENRVINNFKANPAQFNDGSYVFPQHPSYQVWRNAIVKVQGLKCCYCEKPIKNGDLEHYRPKKGWQQTRGTTINRPGYYWLAYRWRNLLLSCNDCNDSSTKGNLFPISGTRAITPRCNLELENMLFINPYEEEPTNHISFYKSDPISLGARGQLTIETFKLRDRGDIASSRKDRFEMYKNAKRLIDYAETGHITPPASELEKLRITLRKASKKTEPFSGMIRENEKKGLL